MKNFIVLIIFLLSTNIFAKEIVTVYTYHKIPPYIVNQDKGETYELLAKLNKVSDDYEFNLKIVPKSRLDYILKPWIKNSCEKYVKRCFPNWIVLWVKPTDFKKNVRDNFFFKKIDNNKQNRTNKANKEYKQYIITNKENEKLFDLINSL